MATDTPDIPDRIGPYEVVRLLGQGGMGLTFEAMRPDLEKPCAIKVIHPHLAAIPKFREMFDNEAKIGAQLRHGRIVGVIDRGEYQGRPYLVMERVDGVNLEQFLKALRNQKGGLLELSLVVFILEALLEGLSYAHGRMLAQQHDIGVIHHDITPGNILISSHGEVLLTDFGIARLVDESGRESKPIGTLLYMAPEQLMGNVSRQSDLYSLGVVFHEMLTGSPPLGKVPEADRRAALLVEPIPPMGRDDVPRELEELRVALLQKHPEKRLRTAAEGLGMLRRYLGDRASSEALRDLYLRIIGPQSSGWTGYLRSAERRGEQPAIQSEWFARLNPAHAKPVEKVPVASPTALDSDRLFWANDPKSGDAAEDEDDQTRTRPWQASPPSLDANAANFPNPHDGAERHPPITDEIRTRRHRRVVRRQSKDNGTGPDGRIEAPSRRSNAVLRPAAVVEGLADAASPPEAPVPSPAEDQNPTRVVTDVLPPPTRTQGGPSAPPVASKTEVAAAPEPDGQGGSSGHDHDRTRRIAGAVVAFLASTAALVHGPGGSEPEGDVQACEVAP